VHCFVSKYTGGDDSWFPMAAGRIEVWNRNGWELVAFRNPNNNDQRGGVYVDFRTVRQVDFYDYGDIRVLH